ncbi:MAG: hypothetical protein OHK0022_41150 [Roseiflexaceae bacterium]
MRTLRFAAFTLVEYTRSGRILIELLATVIVFYLFLWRDPFAADYFFSTTGLFGLGMAFYTTTAIMGLGDRPQGYVVLVRALGRPGYLMGLYLAALAIELGAYGLLSLGVALARTGVDLTLIDWLKGSLPLVLNIALLSALLTLLTPLVLTAGWRLVILGVVAIALSGNLIGGPTMATLAQPVTRVLDLLRTVFSAPLVPPFTGFALAVTRDYSGNNIAIPIAQFFLIVSLLALALYAFSRREIILNS